jgi:prepilin-type processing-associated H-X9-DG protein
MPIASGFTRPFAIAISNYPGNGGNDGGKGLFDADKQFNVQGITDGTSNTLAVGERASRVVVPPSLPDGGQFAGVWAGWSDRGTSGNGGRNWDMQVGPSEDRKVSVVGYTLYRMPDGYSNTAALWPDQAFSSNHTSGANFVMCDGSVRFITYSISWSDANTKAPNPNSGVFNRLGDRDDGQPVSNF